MWTPPLKEKCWTNSGAFITLSLKPAGQDVEWFVPGKPVAVSVTAPMLVEQHQADQVHSQPKTAHNPKQINFDSQSIKPMQSTARWMVVMLWILTKKDYNEPCSTGSYG